MNIEKLGIDIQKLQEELSKSAEVKLRRSLIIDAISRKEKIVVSEEEIDEMINALSEKKGYNPVKIKKYYSNKQNRDQLRSMIREDKTLQMLIQESKVRYS
jgi:FKBP-type peptidyl-prolyl cis-trans isomerase (trigger factor)